MRANDKESLALAANSSFLSNSHVTATPKLPVNANTAAEHAAQERAKLSKLTQTPLSARQHSPASSPPCHQALNVALAASWAAPFVIPVCAVHDVRGSFATCSSSRCMYGGSNLGVLLSETLGSFLATRKG